MALTGLYLGGEEPPDYSRGEAWVGDAIPLPRPVVEKMMEELGRHPSLPRNRVISHVLCAVRSYQASRSVVADFSASDASEAARLLEENSKAQLRPAAQALAEFLDPDYQERARV